VGPPIAKQRQLSSYQGHSELREKSRPGGDVTLPSTQTLSKKENDGEGSLDRIALLIYCFNLHRAGRSEIQSCMVLCQEYVLTGTLLGDFAIVGIS
jgi:hypothetical protein